METRVSLAALAAETSQGLTQQGIHALKAILLLGCYPNVASPDGGNEHRRPGDARYHPLPLCGHYGSSHARPDASSSSLSLSSNRSAAALAQAPRPVYDAAAALHPSSVLASGEFPPAPGELLVYSELLETTKLYLCGATRVPAHALLLAAARVDLGRDARCGRAVCNRWLLLEAELEAEPEAEAAEAGLPPFWDRPGIRRGNSQLSRSEPVSLTAAL